MTTPLKLMLAVALSLPAAAMAATPSSVEKRDAMRTADIEYNERVEYCQGLASGERERCKSEARAKRNEMKAQVNDAYKESDRKLEAATAQAKAGGDRAEKDRALNQAFDEAGRERLDANYRVELARCDSRPEREKKSCQAEAKIKYGKR